VRAWCRGAPLTAFAAGLGTPSRRRSM
jgi:hypothetical protein